MRASLFAAFSLAVLLSSRFSFATPYPYIASILDSGSSTRVTAWGVSGSAQVGHIWIDFFVGPSQAVLWPETSAAPISLHSSVFSETEVWDISGSAQVGDGRGPGSGGEYHALLWHGTPESVVDLHPLGFDSSYANSVSGISQAGLVIRRAISTPMHCYGMEA